MTSKTLPEYLKVALQQVNQSAFYIRSRAINYRFFQMLSNEMGSDHIATIFRSEVRWLSRRLVLSRVFELHEEIEICLRGHKFPLSKQFSNKKFIGALDYLTDIFRS